MDEAFWILDFKMNAMGAMFILGMGMMFFVDDDDDDQWP